MIIEFPKEVAKEKDSVIRDFNTRVAGIGNDLRDDKDLEDVFKAKMDVFSIPQNNYRIP